MEPGLFARARTGGRRFSDEQIFAILRAGEAGGVNTGDLCAEHGVALPTYCVWKAKYRQLTLPALRDLRRRERRRALLVRGAVVTVLVLVTAGPGLFLAPRWMTSSIANDAAAGPAPLTRPASEARTPDAGARAAAVREITFAPPPADEGFAVQVSAVPDAQEALTTVEQLASAGYAAYVLTTTVGEHELYRVRVGPLESRSEARDIVRRLQRDGYAAPWMVK